MDVVNGSELFCPRCNVPLKKFARTRAFLCVPGLRRSLTVELVCRAFAAESINPM
jgi:hypothetical protein